jgi:hypothetical protein
LVGSPLRLTVEIFFIFNARLNAPTAAAAAAATATHNTESYAATL